MNASSLRPLLATLALAAGAAGTDAAQTAPQQVEVRGDAPLRTDVRALCPGIDAELGDALAAVARQEARPAVVDVRFDLNQGTVADVRTGAGPAPYTRALRRAVRALQCDAGASAAPMTVALRVRFVDPFERLAAGQAAAPSLVAASAAAR